MGNSTSHIWVDNDKVFQARPLEDVVNDGLERPDNPKIKWVIYQIFSERSGFFTYDGIGYAARLKDAKAGNFIS